MFGSENVLSISTTIEVDPGSTGTFHLMKAPRALTVVGARMISKQTQNAGTAALLTLTNWDAAGTAVATGGTVVATLGGTAVAAILTANLAGEGVISASQDNIAQGAWLVLQYTEQGTGWISGDRLVYQVDYIFGQT